MRNLLKPQPGQTDRLQRVLDQMQHLSWELLGQRRFASNASDVLLLVAVGIGDAERKPMSAYKLALYIGMPRGTVIRRLGAMTRAGLVQRHADRRYGLTTEGRRRIGRAFIAV